MIFIMYNPHLKLSMDSITDTNIILLKPPYVCMFDFQHYCHIVAMKMLQVKVILIPLNMGP
jgi:hypothetical protein